MLEEVCLMEPAGYGDLSRRI